MTGRPGNSPRGLRLRTRLVLITVTVVVLAMLVRSVLTGFSLYGAEVRAVQDEVTVQAQALAALADTEAENAAEALLLSGGTASGAVVLRDGRVAWVAGAPVPVPPDPAFLADFVPRAVCRCDGYVTASVRTGDTVVQVARSLEPVTNTLRLYALTSALTLAVVAVFAALGTALAVQRALRPLERLARRVERLDTPEPVPDVHRRGEIGDVARALDASLTELREQRVREERFLANASHELRTPVSAMLADLEHILSQPRPPEQDREALRRAQRLATRLRDLTSDLLTLQRARRPLEPRPLNLLDVAGDAVDRLMPLAIRANLDVILSGSDTRVHGDPSMLARMVENLLGNALKFTPEGEVRVTVRPLGDAAELLVEDTGVGLKGGTEVLFEPFRRGDAPAEGFGLGLAVVRDVVQAHGGRVRLEPREGGGTRARVVLPVRPEPTDR